jgi:hypothetical protein
MLKFNNFSYLFKNKRYQYGCYKKLGFYAYSFNLWDTINVFLYTIIYLILFVLITDTVGININIELYNSIVKHLSLNFGLLKVQYAGPYIQDPGVVLTSYRSIYGLKTYILISLVGLIVTPALFIVQNVNFILLNILGIIFTRALVKDFHSKHFSWKLSNTRGGFNASNLKYLMAKISRAIRASNIERIIWFLFKIISISIILMVIVRSSVFYLFMGISPTNWIGGALVITLSQPIYYYFMNFATKKIKKEKFTSDDSNLFNNYVVKSTNLYRTSYLLCLHYIIINYYYAYIIVIMVLTIIIFMFLVCFLLYKKPKICNGKPLILESNGGEIMALITSFVAMAPALKEACDNGYAHYFSHEGAQKHLHWKKIYFNKPGEYYMGQQTVNIVNISKAEENLYADEPEYADIIKEHRNKLNNSPILNMAYNQKNNMGTHTSADDWKIKPLSFFSNEYFYGSVSQSLRGKFLIINIIREDLNSSTFMPSFYLPDKTPEGQARIQDLTDILQIKYNIHLPIGPAARNGYMIFTQAEPLFGSKSLLKVWRPSIQYTQPESLKQNTTVRDYYRLKESNMIRLQEFNNGGVIQTIQQMAAKNCISELDTNNAKDELKQVVTNELVADRLSRKMIKLFIDRGKELNLEGKYIIDNLETTLDNNNEECTYFTAAEADLKPVEDLVEIAEQARKGRAAHLKKGKGKLLTAEEQLTEWAKNYKDSEQNHVYFNDRINWGVLEARRLYPVDWSIWTSNYGFSAYVSIYGKGVIEGFKESDQGLGKINTEFELDLNKSRADLIQRIGEKYRYMGCNYHGIQSIYGISVNRLTFEFFEVRADSNIFGYKNLLTKEIELHNCEVYSIIDTLNDNVKFPLKLNTGTSDIVIPKHDYNFLDDKDEHSIRKFMDFIYANDNGYLSYRSDIANTVMADTENRMEGLNITGESSRNAASAADRRREDTHDIIRRLPRSVFKPGTSATFSVGKKVMNTEWDDEDLFLFDTRGWKEKMAKYDREHGVVYPEEPRTPNKRKGAFPETKQKKIRTDFTGVKTETEVKPKIKVVTLASEDEVVDTENPRGSIVVALTSENEAVITAGDQSGSVIVTLTSEDDEAVTGNPSGSRVVASTSEDEVVEIENPSRSRVVAFASEDEVIEMTENRSRPRITKRKRK